jgi:hypothetical protein
MNNEVNVYGNWKEGLEETERKVGMEKRGEKKKRFMLSKDC